MHHFFPHFHNGHDVGFFVLIYVVILLVVVKVFKS